MLQLDPRRERGIYNSTVRRPKAMLAWVRTDLRKHLGIRQRGLTMPDVEAYNRETVSQVEDTLSQAPETENTTTEEPPLVPVLGVRGRRPDHDQLPEDVQAIYDRNAERWRKMRQLHAQLAQMIASPGYAPCDGNELCYILRQTDTELRADWQLYDEYVITPKEPEGEAPTEDPDKDADTDKRDSVEVFTDNVKTIQNARTAITRGLKVESPNEAQLQKLQKAVDTLVALKQVIKPETIKRLEAVGVNVPK